ncbi:Signal transducing adapter molecule 1 [Halotydeus destructor]|nr:Signal transducing adapter molecule 1 [Halotydeus destructor]
MARLFGLGGSKEDPKLTAMKKEEDDLAKAIAASLQETKPTLALSPPVKPAPDPNVVSNDQEQDDIAKAIAESLKDKKAVKASEIADKRKSGSSSGSLYPTFNGISSTTPSSFSANTTEAAKEMRKVRALYDFEAAEDNELTFKAGEIIVVSDDSDSNWWKGSNHRGDGLFPSNFVTADLDEVLETKTEKKSVQFSDEVKVKVMETEQIEINEEKVDKLLHLLHEADPSGDKVDSEELLVLEEQCTQMNQLIDAKLEKVDKKHAALSMVNQQLMDALAMYHSLMKESLNMPSYYPNPSMPGAYGGIPQNYQPTMGPMSQQQAEYSVAPEHNGVPADYGNHNYGQVQYPAQGQPFHPAQGGHQNGMPGQMYAGYQPQDPSYSQPAANVPVSYHSGQPNYQPAPSDQAGTG